MRGKDASTLTSVPGVFAGGCLVLAGETHEAPKVLLAALASRGLAPIVLHDEPAVMTALAGKTHGRRVLVVVDPDQRGRLAELIDAVKVYHTDVLCWQYAEAGDTQGEKTGRSLSVLEIDPDSMLDHESGAPIGQIVGRHRPVDDLLVKVPGAPLASREIVTQEELSMLLGPAPGEAS